MVALLSRRSGLLAILASLAMAFALALTVLSASPASAQDAEECPAGTTAVVTIQGTGGPEPKPFSETVTINGETVVISGTITNDQITFETSPPTVIDVLVFRTGNGTF